jgi:hypothetical protein
MEEKPTIHSSIEEIQNYIPVQQFGANYVWRKEKTELLRKKNSLRFKLANFLISTL